MASGDSLVRFTAQTNEPPASNYATGDTRNGHWVLDFDATTDEEAVFRDIMDSKYAGGGYTVTVKCSMSSATTGNVVVQAAFENVDGLDIDSDSFAELNTSGAVAVPAAAGTEFDVTITFTDGEDADSVGVGDQFRLKIRRDADDTSATDSASGDLELLAVEIQET